MDFHRSATLTWLLAFTLPSCFAGDLAFRHTGGLSAEEHGDGFYTAWNPTGGHDLLQPGVKVVFFGSAPACDSQLRVGPVSASTRYSPEDLTAYTGLAHEAHAGEVLTPTADSQHCNASRATIRDGSFVLLGAAEEKAGIGLFTTVGPDSAGRHPLVDTFNAQGQHGSGANVNIAGTFVLFRFNWDKSSPSLWQLLQAPDRQDAAVLEIKTTQSVATSSLGQTQDAPDAPVKQAKQQLTVTLLNRECHRALVGRSCQLQYLFTLGIVRSGVTDWNKVDWFQAARVWIDPAQGNMPVVDGPIKSARQVTQDASRKFDLYTSDGDATAHALFNTKRFGIRLGWGQFKNAIRIATATTLKKPPEAVTRQEIEQLFGGRWNDPAAWVLVDAEVGQEVYNAKPDSEAHIGGSFTDISIGSDDAGGHRQ